MPSTAIAARSSRRIANAGSGDHFTLVFDEPVAVKSIAVETGKTAGGDKLDAGSLQVSADGKAFEPLARFADGAVRSELKDRPGPGDPHQARDRSEASAGDPRAGCRVRPPVATFRVPVRVRRGRLGRARDEGVGREGRAGVRAVVPDDQRGASGATATSPPALIRLTLKNDYAVVAGTSGDRITGSASFFKANPDDIGAMIHETTHVVPELRAAEEPVVAGGRGGRLRAVLQVRAPQAGPDR